MELDGHELLVLLVLLVLLAVPMALATWVLRR
jgi:hypothetical protein